jgi:hypothetical protein
VEKVWEEEAESSKRGRDTRLSRCEVWQRIEGDPIKKLRMVRNVGEDGQNKTIEFENGIPDKSKTQEAKEGLKEPELTNLINPSASMRQEREERRCSERIMQKKMRKQTRRRRQVDNKLKKVTIFPLIPFLFLGRMK